MNKKKNREFIDSYITAQNFLGEGRHSPVTTNESFDDAYIQDDSNSDTYFNTPSAEQNLEKMKTRFIDIIEELKRTRSLWKIKLIVGVVFEYDRHDKKVEIEIFIDRLDEKNHYSKNRFR